MGCMYHNARKNSVVRHMKTQHHRVAEEDDIPFDNHLSSIEPPKMRRVGSSSSASVSSLPGSVESLLGLPAQGPSDDELFRLSEEKRRVVMEITRKEHAEWMGGEDALKIAVPDYPAWTQRDHPYGRAPSVGPEESKHEAQSQSPTPELLVSSPEPEPLVPTSTGSVNAWSQSGSPPIHSMSGGFLAPHTPLIISSATPRTPISTTTQAWYGGALTCSDSMLPNYPASTLPYQLSPSIVSDAFSVPGLERDTLFSPGALSSSPPLASPLQQFYSPETPRNDNFLATVSDASSNSIYGSQFSDDGACSEPLFPDPTALGVLPQGHLIHDVKSEFSFGLTFPEWTNVASET
ncbi:hypothetical protein FRC01_007398 [Tulasnella sp. 417]|nr:hypothetical protein FRC01_007398 [Tulasnella sp. 417]